MDIFRDLLDKQIVDSKGNRLGKVDGIIMTVPARAKPRLYALETGSSVLARRLGPRAGKLVDRFERWVAGKKPVPFRIPWAEVKNVGKEIDVETELESTRLHAWQEWLRHRVISFIPGN
jgi:sporulation protein YlmC with PRC-barrel domain